MPKKTVLICVSQNQRKLIYLPIIGLKKSFHFWLPKSASKRCLISLYTWDKIGLKKMFNFLPNIGLLKKFIFFCPNRPEKLLNICVQNRGARAIYRSCLICGQNRSELFNLQLVIKYIVLVMTLGSQAIIGSHTRNRKPGVWQPCKGSRVAIINVKEHADTTWSVMHMLVTYAKSGHTGNRKPKLTCHQKPELTCHYRQNRPELLKM